MYYTRSAGLTVNAFDSETQSGGNESVNKYPDECPICHEGIHPLPCYAYIIPHNDYPDTYEEMQAIFRCPRNSCNALFVAFYRKSTGVHSSGKFYYQDTFRLQSFKPEAFPETINKISERFSRIYNQSKIAEGNNLLEICGPGYRKALEFLVKDYLISSDPTLTDKVKSELLGESIKRIDDQRIQKCAKHAAWLGNDETHYYRKWEDKDLEDLKTLIRLTVIWIESTLLTEGYNDEMSSPKVTTTKK